MLTQLDDLLTRGVPEAPAVIHRDRTLSYGELVGQVRRVAAGLRGIGLRHGERVVVHLDKRVETVITMFAVSAAGGVLVPVNPAFKAQQVRYVAADCAAAVVITTAERYRGLAPDLAAVSAVRHVVLLGDTDVADATADEVTAGPAGVPVTPWAELARATPEERAVPPAGGVVDTDPAAILYTSGSTGGPKGVVLSHRNLIAGAESVAAYLGHTSEDVVLSVLPFSFDAGFSQLTTTFLVGARVVLVNYLLPREVVRLCARHRVTALTCVPPLWLQLAGRDWPEEAGRHLRYFANTGGHMPRTLLTRLREIFPQASPYLMYGLTEAFRSTYLDPAEVDRRPDSIGRSVPNANVRVVRADGSPCAPGEHGEIVHRGPLVALGYWNDPERTAARFRPFPPVADGLRAETAVWSGDTAYSDAEGFLYFVGRTDDMIKTSGYRVSPTEIEEAAYGTGLVAEAAALGLPDDRPGQRVVLAVAAEPGGECDTETLLKALKRDLPGYMVPGQVLVLPRLPRSGNGKFDRTALRGQVS